MVIQRRAKILMLAGLFVALLAPLSPAVLASPRVAYAAPTGCNVTGESYGTQSTGNTIAASGKTADVILPPGGTQNLNSSSSLAVSTQAITDSSYDISTPTQASAVSTSTVDGASVANGAITGNFQSVSNSTSNGATAATSSAGTYQNYSINNGPMQTTPAPNTQVVVPGIGNAIINEQIQTNGTTSISLTVIGLDLTVITATTFGGAVLPAGTRVIVAYATSAVDCSGLATANQTQTAIAGQTQTAGAGQTQTAAAGQTQTTGQTQTASAGQTQSASQTQTAAAGQTQTASAGQSQTAAAGQTQTAAAGQTQTAAAGQTQTAAANATNTAAAGAAGTAAAGATNAAATNATNTAAAGATGTAAAAATNVANIGPAGATGTAAAAATNAANTAAAGTTGTAAAGATNAAATNATNTAAAGATGTAAAGATGTAAAAATNVANTAAAGATATAAAGATNAANTAAAATKTAAAGVSTNTPVAGGSSNPPAAATATSAPSSGGAGSPSNTPTSGGTGNATAPAATATAVTGNPTVAISPSDVNPGDSVIVSGGGFAPNEPVTVALGGNGAAGPTVTATANGDGTLPPTAITIPTGLAPGSYTITATGGASGRNASGSVTVRAAGTSRTVGASIALSAAMASPGGLVTVRGTGFGHRERVTLSLNGAALSPVVTRADGSFTARLRAPNGLLNGVNSLGASGATSGRSAVTTLMGRLATATTFYFVGASTMPGEQARLPLLNPNVRPARVELTFYYNNGAPRQVHLNVAAHSRTTAILNTLAGANRVFGLRLAANRPVVAQLSVERHGQDNYGLLGVSAPHTGWYLAEGYTGLTFHETLAVLNPGGTPALVRLRLLPFGGRRARMVSVLVAPRRVRLVDVNRLMPGLSLSVIATSRTAIVLARRLTFSTRAYGITAQTGINIPATSWLFAEGTTTTRFETFLTILNPNRMGTRVTARFYGRTGALLGHRTIYVPGLRRANIKLNDVLHASGVASLVTSAQPIVVERPEYFGSPNGRRIAGSDVFGRNGAGLRWTFPGGLDAGRSEFLLLYNPSARTVAIDATSYGSNGRMTTRRFNVPPTTRVTVDVARMFRGLTVQHGFVLRAANGLGFVAEQTLFAPNFSTLDSTQGAAS